MSAAPEALLTLRRSRVQTDPDQEGWLVAYADLITLLFVFFSVILSISVVSKAKFELLSGQFNQSSAVSMVELKKRLDQEVTQQGLQSQVSTEITDEGLEIRFSESILFASGEAALNEQGTAVLRRFAPLLSKLEPGFRLSVEGHTDDRPIRTAAFPSNWSLSAIRALNVLHLMAESGVDQKKLLLKALADNRPIAADASESARAKNRRVTLLVH
jgi:chemotaxis protein MotB